jgi:NADH-quinone oxidoreductase subunit A
MKEQYLPVLIQAVIAIGFAAVTLLISVALGKAGKRNATKNTAYECGMIATGNSQPRFSVKFYLVAMLFILFDIEVVFMYPWATVYRDYIATQGSGGPMIFVSMFGFVSLIFVGYLYALRKGVLDWTK